METGICLTGSVQGCCCLWYPVFSHPITMSCAYATKISPSRSLAMPHWQRPHPSPQACSLLTQTGDHSPSAAPWAFCPLSQLPNNWPGHRHSPENLAPHGPANKATCTEYFYVKIAASLLPSSRDIPRKVTKFLSKNPSLAGRGQGRVSS